MFTTPAGGARKRRIEPSGEPSAKSARTSGATDIEDRIAALEAAAADVKALGAGALDASTAERVARVGDTISSLELSFRRAAAARQKMVAARPADDAVLGGAVTLELDALEHVLSYLPPKDMATAERVNRHFQQAVRHAAPARAAALGFELAERETLTLELLSRMEREKREAPGLLQHADISSLTRLWSFHFSVLRPLLDDEKLLTLLKEVANNKPTKRAFAAWRVVVRAKPAPSWAARNKSIIEAGLQATGTFASVAAVITKMPASIAEEHVESLGAALSVLLAGPLADSHSSVLERVLGLLAKMRPQARARIRAGLDACRRDCVGKDDDRFATAARLARELVNKADSVAPH